MTIQPHILVVLWIEQPKALLEKIRADFPGYKVSYFRQQSLEEQRKHGEVKETNERANRGGVPTGELCGLVKGNRGLIWVVLCLYVMCILVM
jgi:hypothetical protein